MNLFYCLCGDLLEVGSPAKGSRMLGWLGQFSDGQETSVDGSRMGWDGRWFYQWYLPSPPVGWMRSSVGACRAEKIVGCGVWKKKSVQG